MALRARPHQGCHAISCPSCIHVNALALHKQARYLQVAHQAGQQQGRHAIIQLGCIHINALAINQQARYLQVAFLAGQH